MKETLVPVTAESLCRPLEWRDIFENDQPVEIDLGAGDGFFAAAYAAQHPDRNFLAVERLLGRVRKIVKKAERRELNNLKVLRLESAYVMEYLVPAGSVSCVHLMFPDPWPKRKHQKNRLLQEPFVRMLHRALIEGGEFRFTTDHADYFQSGCAAVEAAGLLQKAPLWDLAEYPQTDFQKEFEAEGRLTFRQRWGKP